MKKLIIIGSVIILVIVGGVLLFMGTKDDTSIVVEQPATTGAEQSATQKVVIDNIAEHKADISSDSIDTIESSIYSKLPDQSKDSYKGTVRADSFQKKSTASYVRFTFIVDILSQAVSYTVSLEKSKELSSTSLYIDCTPEKDQLGKGNCIESRNDSFVPSGNVGDDDDF